MSESEVLVNLLMPVNVYVEHHQGISDATDVIVEMEDGTMYTALFVTLEYLKRQMELTRDFCEQIPETIPACFTALDTPHIVVESLQRDFIEDTIDNLLAMEIFEGVFTLVTETSTQTTEAMTTNGNGSRATQEVAAVVVSDVLVVEG